MGTLGDFLDQRVPGWRTAYTQSHGQWYFDTLRLILEAIGIKAWIEVTYHELSVATAVAEILISCHKSLCVYSFK